MRLLVLKEKKQKLKKTLEKQNPILRDFDKRQFRTKEEQKVLEKQKTFPK